MSAPMIDPLTGMPVDPAMMATGAPPPMMNPAGGAMSMDALAGGPPPQQVQAPFAAQPPQPPPLPDMGGIDMAVMVLMDGTEEEVLDLLAELDPTALGMLRELVSDEISKQDPRRAEYLLSFLPEKKMSGALPSWMKSPPPRPSAERVNELAMLDAEEWAEVVKNDKDTLDYLIPPFKSRVFKSFDEKKSDRYQSPILGNEINLIVSKGAASEYRYEMPFTDPAHTDATQQCEDYLYECDRHATELWAASGYGDFEMDLWYTLATKGRIVHFIQPCIEAEDHFLTERLMDPSNTYPTWAGERGLERVTRQYDATAAEVIGDYDPTGEYGVERKIVGHVLKGDKNRVYESDTRGVVTQYWDRWWYVVLFDGIEVVNTSHQYGFVPFVVTAGNTGMPKYLGEITPGGGLTATRMRDTLKSAKYASYIDRMKEFAGVREKVGTVFLTMMQRMDRPSWLLYQDAVAQAKGTPDINLEATVNPLELDREKLEPFPQDQMPPAVFQPFYNMFGQDASMTFMPEAAHGVSAGANQSGNAMENQYEVGNDKFVGMYKAMARHKEAVAKMRLALWRDWGHAWKDERGKMGRMMIPYPRDRKSQLGKQAPPAYEFMPETVEMVGTKVVVDYTSVRMQNLTQLGNAVMIWQQARAMSAREAMEMRGVRNPESVMDQIYLEQLMSEPDMIKLKALDALRKVDPELASKYESIIAGGAGGGPGGGSPAKPSPNSSAMNLTGMGMGAQGPTGRPATGGPGVPPVGVSNG